MARFLVRETEKGETAHHLSTLYRTWALIALAFPLLAAAGVAIAPIHGELRWAIVAGLVAIPPLSFYKLVLERRRAAGEVSSAATLDIAETLGAFALGALFCLWGAGGAGPLWGVAVAAALSVAPTLPRELKLLAGGRFQKARAREYVAYGYPVALSLILSLVLGAADRFLIAGFLGEADVGVYHAGYSLANRTLDVMFIWFGMASGPALVAALERRSEHPLASAIVQGAEARGAARWEATEFASLTG